MATRLNNPSLMSMNSTESAAAKTTATADDAELDLFQSCDASFSIVAWMPAPGIRQVIYKIHLSFAERHHRRILHYVMATMFLHHVFAVKRILFCSLQTIRLRKKFTVILNFF